MHWQANANTHPLSVTPFNLNRVDADEWEKDVWDFQAKSGSRLFLHFLGKSHFKICLGKRLEGPNIFLPDIRGLLIQMCPIPKGPKIEKKKCNLT